MADLLAGQPWSEVHRHEENYLCPFSDRIYYAADPGIPET